MILSDRAKQYLLTAVRDPEVRNEIANWIEEVSSKYNELLEKLDNDSGTSQANYKQELEVKGKGN